MDKLWEFIFAIVISVLLFSFVVRCTDSVKSDKDRYHNKVGSTVVVNKDTLTIVDYKYWSSKFILSNGTEVLSEIVFNKNNKE